MGIERDIVNDDKVVNSKRLIFRNSLYLFVRSTIVILLGLYASRVLLEKIGIEDFGVFNIVGGIVVMFNSLRSMFTNSIQRFLNYSRGDIGEGNKQNQIFNAGIQVQLILSVAFIVLTETIGLYAFLHLNLTEEQFSVAHVVYQLTIATAVVSIMTAPYDALIISKEKMDVYAMISVIDSTLHLAIIYLIDIGPFSQLVNYSILLFVVSCLIRMFSITYCHRHFMESRIQRTCNKTIMSEMAKFAGWNFLGNTGLYISHQGVNYILNLTGGVVVNAARTITYQVMKGANVLVGNVNIAFKPQTNAAAANDDKQDFYRLLGYNAKTAYACFLLIIVPLLVFARQVVGLWLGQVPEYVISFLLAISPYYLLRSLHELVNQFFISIGEMKWYQIIEISTMILIIPLAWLMLKDGYPFWAVFLCMALVETVNHFGTVWLAVRKYAFPFRLFLREVYLPFALMAVIAFLVIEEAYRTWLTETDSFFEIVVWGSVIECLMLFMMAFIVLTRQERCYIMKIIGLWLKREKS